jgi:hypothetical protein
MTPLFHEFKGEDFRKCELSGNGRLPNGRLTNSAAGQAAVPWLAPLVPNRRRILQEFLKPRVLAQRVPER